MGVRVALVRAQRIGLSVTNSSRCLFRSVCTSEQLAAVDADPATNLFVSGLNASTTSQGLKEAFSKLAEIRRAWVLVDDYHDSLGFGFVRSATVEGAAECIKGMSGKVLDGSVISVDYARPRTPAELRSSVNPWKWSKRC